MHLLDVDRGFYGGWGIVGGQLPLATGLALALVRQRQAAGGALRARRRRGEHGRLARVAQPRRAVEAADRLPRRQQRVRHGHERRRARRPSRSSTSAPSAYRMHGERVDGDDLEAVIEASDAAARARPRGARAGRARGGHLPLPRPLGRRRRARLPHARTRSPSARQHDPIAARAQRGCASAGVGDGRAATRSTERVERARRRPRSSSRDASPEPDVDELAARRCTRRAAASSSRACGRAARSARRSSSSTRGWAHERASPSSRRTGTERMTYREALRLALREELARDERVFVMGEEVGVFEGSYKVTAGLMDEFGAGPRPRHADLRGGLRRRRRRRGDARRAPGRRDHDAQLPARRDGPGRQPRRQDRRDVRRRGRAARWSSARPTAPATSSPPSTRSRFDGWFAGTPGPEGRRARQRRPTPRAC